MSRKSAMDALVKKKQASADAVAKALNAENTKVSTSWLIFAVFGVAFATVSVFTYNHFKGQ